MKKIALLLLLVLSLALGSCNIASGNGGSTTASSSSESKQYTISLNAEKSFTLELGAEDIDFTEYFIIQNRDGDNIVVTEDMLDLTFVDTSKVGIFIVTLTYRSEICTATFIVVDENGNGGNGGGNGGEGGGPTTPTTYESEFIDETLSVGSGQLGYTASATPFGFDPARGVQFLQKDGTVTITSAQSLINVGNVSLVVTTNCETGMKISVKVGNSALKSNGQSTVTVVKADGTTTVNFATDFVAYSGAISITLTPTATSKSMYISSVTVNGTGNGGGNGGNNGGGSNTGNTMPSQSYNPSTLDKSNLQDQLLDIDGAIGLPSTGTYSCLVVPIQFSGDSITSADLAKLNKAFNGTSADTGWESVSSYYKEASGGLLNMSFDIQNVYQTSKSASYYNNYSKEVDLGDGYTTTQTGAELLLLEVLAKLEREMDLTKYDYNNDGCIDGIYLIYSAPVDYEDDNSIFWAYVSYYVAGEDTNQTFDGLDAYYYLFAGFDFMDEDADTNDGFEYLGTIPGLKVNASTYIHETGHMLGIDDYYDYYQGEGSDDGLGGADMMDYAVGDHNPYTKIMMGWITPTIITSTTTVNLQSFAESGQCLMVLLNYNNSYFCEYLLIDFYTATGLNQVHADQELSYLWDGAEYGVRIYHVVSWIDNPYSDEYSSVTNNNNSISDVALLKYLEADGTNQFTDSDGYAMADDLWQTGDKLSTVFPGYTREDGKALNFDIIINSTSASGASVTISFQD